MNLSLWRSRTSKSIRRSVVSYSETPYSMPSSSVHGMNKELVMIKVREHALKLELIYSGKWVEVEMY